MCQVIKSIVYTKRLFLCVQEACEGSRLAFYPDIVQGNIIGGNIMRQRTEATSLEECDMDTFWAFIFILQWRN